MMILEQLQQDVAEVTAHNGLVLLTGDFDARTGEAADTLDADIAGDLLDNTLQPAVSTPLPLRKSADTKVCPFGKSLLNICQSSDMVIVNGRAKGDEMGAYTCHISKGSSVVDYFITSSSLMASVRSMIVQERCLESDHCPLMLMLDLQAENLACVQATDAQDEMAQVKIKKINYRPEKVESYREALNHLLHPGFITPEHDCCFATVLQSCIAQAAIAVFGCPGKHACPKVRQSWYDEECKVARASMKHLLPGTTEHSAKKQSVKRIVASQTLWLATPSPAVVV